MMRQFLGVIGLVMFAAANTASALSIDVFAKANSTSGGGVGGSTGVVLSTGDYFTVSADADDLWSAGALPRWSNADGLIVDLFATGSDESGQLAGTLIGEDFGLHNQHGLSLPYGSLVGSIDNNFFLIGTQFAGNAVATGELLLWYWDSNNVDNSEDIRVTINVPEPAVWLLLGAGFAGVAVCKRRCR